MLPVMIPAFCQCLLYTSLSSQINQYKTHTYQASIHHHNYVHLELIVTMFISWVKYRFVLSTYQQRLHGHYMSRALPSLPAGRDAGLTSSDTPHTTLRSHVSAISTPQDNTYEPDEISQMVEISAESRTSDSAQFSSQGSGDGDLYAHIPDMAPHSGTVSI